MGYRYNSPPNWPAPPSRDWLPPEGWAPDPSWPAAPAGWNFWVEDPGFAGPPSGVATAARPVAQTVAPKENRLRAQLHEALAAELQPGEELRWFGVVYQYRAPRFVVGLFAWSILLPILGPLIATILRRPWSVGVTSERVFFGHFLGLQVTKGPIPMISVPLAGIAVVRKGRRTGTLVVTAPPEGLPANFTLIRGSNIDELEALLHT